MCSQENLARGLTAVKSAVTHRATLPLRTHIRLDARTWDGRVRFGAMNLDVGINAWICPGHRAWRDGGPRPPHHRFC